VYPVIDVGYPLMQFFDGAPQPGQYSIPFTFMLPDWLPASLAVVTDHDRARMTVSYYLTAKFVPKIQMDK